MAIGLLLMAAGRSRRFKIASHGRHKLLYQPDPSIPCILESTYQKARAIFDAQQICIVVNHAEPEVKQFAQRLESPVQLIHSNGIGESIAQAVTAHQDWSGILILHADLPLIQKETIQSVVGALEHHIMVRPLYQNHAGHPVGFQPLVYPQLIALKGDQGANKILAQDHVTFIPVQDEGSIQDIDTPKDFENYLQSL